MAGAIQIEIDNVLSKFRKLEDAIKSGIEITQECALDCEENDEGCPEVAQLKDVMLAYVGMTRDIRQWDNVARQTVTDFRKNYDPAGEEDMNIVKIFKKKLENEQSDNKPGDLESHKVLRDFRENIWNIHHSGENFADRDENVPEEEGILIEKVTGDKLLCPITKTEMKNPMKNKVCGHNYDKMAIEQHVKRMKQRAKCPVVGCPHIVRLEDLEVNVSLSREVKKRH